MWRTDPVDPIAMDRNSKIQDERNPLSKPQVFVQLQFGVSWAQRHSPRTHTVTYASRNLRDARDKGHFPRQAPPTNTTNFLAASDQRQHRQREQREQREQSIQSCHQHQSQQPSRAHSRTREHERTGEHDRDEGREHRPQHQRRASRSDSGGVSYERGNSAPPPFHDGPWDATPGLSASLFPTAAQITQEQPRIWKPLPEPPSRFRLGDGLPWSAWAWPVDAQEPDDAEDDADDLPYANQPTTVLISPERRHRSDDPDQSRELESLSAAMMTVDNGFENQWWYQGSREETGWWPRDQEEPSRMSMNEAPLLSAAEPPVMAPSEGWYAPDGYNDAASSLGVLVSPISNISSPSGRYRPLHRSLSTRSEELSMGGF